MADGQNANTYIQHIVKLICCIGNQIKTQNGEDAMLSEHLFLDCYSSFIASDDLLTAFISMSTNDKIDMKTRIKSTNICEKWLTNYWKQDFEFNENITLNIIDETNNNWSSDMVKLYDNCSNKSEIENKTKYLIKCFVSKSYYPNELINIISTYLCIGELLSQKIKSTFNRLQLHKTTHIQEQKEEIKMNTINIPNKYNILNQSNAHIAEQITLMDFKIFSNIKRREIVNSSWKSKHKNIISPNISRLIQRFNELTYWIQYVILTGADYKKRAAFIKKFINIGNHLLLLNNIHAACAVCSALKSVPIHRIKKSWKKVATKHIVKFEELKTVFSNSHGYKNLRKLHGEIRERLPAIPYVGMLLIDVRFIEEGNRLINDESGVNFNVLFRHYDSFQRILCFQDVPYSFDDDIIMQNYLLQSFKNDEIDDIEEYIWNLSKNVKKQETEKKKSIFSVFGSK
eukprot:84822_1